MKEEVSNVFKIGDKVIAIDIISHNDLRDCRGTVVGLLNDSECSYVAVEFDDKIEAGHDCNGQGQKGHCWYCQEETLQLCTDEEFFTEEDINNILRL